MPFFSSGAQDLRKQRAWNNSVSAMFVFGDSTVDPGNNNFISTAFRSNFHPYGQDFENQTATGRFTNGRLTTDFVASYVGLKEYLPPYLDPNLSMEDLMTGEVIDMPRQLEYFKEYKRRVESAIGKQKMEQHIKRAVFLISAGTNDFIVNYYALPIRRKTYTLSGYQQFLFQQVKQFLQGLWEEGARKIAVSGLPPMGCLPAVITLNSYNALLQRGCIEKYSFVARQFNLMLQNEVNSMHFGTAHLGAKIYFVDIYAPLADMIQGKGRLAGAGLPPGAQTIPARVRGEETRSLTVGRTCTPTRESRHEVHPATTTITERPRPRVGGGNGRGLWKAEIQREPIKR
ncbi:GDSL esterase/lipase [Citrus sinensis]|nr:GDSL esterase/lipase [Citrus sinensis]